MRKCVLFTVAVAVAVVIITVSRRGIVELARWANRLLTRIRPRKSGGHVPVQVVHGLRVLGVGLGQLAGENLRLLLQPSRPQGLTLGVALGPARVTPSSSGTWLGTCVHGLKLSAGGMPLTKAVLIGEATRSN